MDDDGEAVDQAAREAIDHFGNAAVSVLRERAEVADYLEQDSVGLNRK